MKPAIFLANLLALILASSPAVAYNCPSGRYSLTVNTEPPDSRVRFENIRVAAVYRYAILAQTVFSSPSSNRPK